VAASAASPMAVLRPGSLTSYWRFQRGVAKAQLAAWLPAERRLLIDISGPAASSPAQAAARGHTVVRVSFGARAESPPAWTALSTIPAGADGARGPWADRRGPRAGRRGGHRRPAAAGHGGPGGRTTQVLAEPGSLAFITDGCADGVIAEDGALSRYLVAEDLAAEIARVLRPGGELLACVDSLVLGMAILAEQHHWAQLTDVPNAEVVLVPWPDGTITRCFGAAQLNDLLTEVGLEVLWIRPRTVLSPSVVDHVLSREPGALARLVKAELHAGQYRPDESFGISLLAAARKPPAG
jgi:hypothetical protein